MATLRRTAGRAACLRAGRRRNGGQHPPRTQAAVHIDPYIVLGSAIIGLLVGMTGAGGGRADDADADPALRGHAVDGDLERPGRRGRDAPDRRRRCTCAPGRSTSGSCAGWWLGSVPAAFLGAYLLHLLGDAKSAQNTHRDRARARRCSSGAGAMALRFVLDRRSGQTGRDRFDRDRAPAAADHRDRRHRRPDRRHDVGRLGFADDRAAPVRLSDDRRQPAGRAPT